MDRVSLSSLVVQGTVLAVIYTSALPLALGQAAVPLGPTADAHVREALPNNNFGNATSMEVQGGKRRSAEAFLRFDLSGVPSVGQATLRLFARNSGSAQIAMTAHGVGDLSWAENTIRWANRPVLGAQLSEGVVSNSQPAWLELDVTSHVASEKAAGRNVISLGLRSTDNANRFIQINSRESASDGPVLVIVPPNDPPTVSLIEPADGAVFVAPVNITLQTAVSDSGDTISRIEFYEGTTLLASLTDGSTSFVWTNPAPGGYVLSARAYDSLGAVGVSDPVQITVQPGANQPPVVTLTEPLPGQTAVFPATIAVRATASDGDGTVVWVEFFSNGEKIGEDSQPPHALDWINPAPGTHAVTARARDNLGASGDSQAVTIQILDEDSDYDGRTNWQEAQDGTDLFDPGSFAPARLAHFAFNTPGLEGERGQLPRARSAVNEVSSWSGNAVEFSQNSSQLAYNAAEADATANINCRQGSVRLWFKPNWTSANRGGTGPQSWPDLIQVGRWRDPPTIGHWGLGVSADGNYIQFSGQTNGSHLGFVAVPISFVANTWHQIVLTYSPVQSTIYVDGMPVALLVDGAPLGRGRGVTVYPGPQARSQYGLQLGSNNGNQPIRGQLDEIETFNYLLTPQEVMAGFPNFHHPDEITDSDYDGRSDLMETLVDATDPGNALSVAPVRLGYWRFNDPGFQGERGQFPLSGSAAAVPSWSGAALSAPAQSGAGLVYRDVETNGLANINCRKGSVRFWFKPNWTSGGGPADGRLIEVGDDWRLSVVGGGAQLAFWSNHQLNEPPLLQSPISWSVGQWHQIVLCYDQTQTLLYVDGAATSQSPGPGVSSFPSAVARADSFRIGAGVGPGSEMDGSIEELETFNHLLAAADIATEFERLRAVDGDLDGVADTAQDAILAQSEPFAQTPFVVTGAIEAEQFDRGGPGVAYHSTTVHPANEYRAGEMLVEPCDDLAGGYCLSNLRPGEWVKYTFVVHAAGYYTFEARVAPVGPNPSSGIWRIELAQANGIPNYASGPLGIPNAGWQDVSLPGIYLEAGPNAFKLVMQQGGTDGYVGRFNYVSIYPTVNENSFPSYTVPVVGLVAGEAGTDLGVAQANSAAIQAAVDDVLRNQGGTVLIPPGKFYLAESIRTNPNDWEVPGGNGGMSYAVLMVTTSQGIAVGSNIRVTGHPAGGTELVSHNRSTSLFWALNTFGWLQPASFGHVTLENLTLRGRPHTRSDGSYEPGWFRNAAEYAGTGAMITAGGLGATPLKQLHIHKCTFINPSTYPIILSGVDGARIESNDFICLNGEIPDGEPLRSTVLVNDGVTGPHPAGLVGIFSTGGGSRNVVVTENLYDGYPGLRPDQVRFMAEDYSGDGLAWFQAGGNWFVGRNLIRNYGLEGIQMNAGPGAVVANTFLTTQRSSSTCALSMGGNWPTLAGQVTDRTYYFIGNCVEGGRQAVLSAYPQYASDPNMRLYGHFSGNEGYFYPPVTFWPDFPPSFLNLMRCERAHISANTLLSGDFGLRTRYGVVGAEIRNNNFSAATVASLDFQGELTGLAEVLVTQNQLGSSLWEHLWLNWFDAPNVFLIGNGYLDPAGELTALFTDPAGAQVHLSGSAPQGGPISQTTLLSYSGLVIEAAELGWPPGLARARRPLPVQAAAAAAGARARSLPNVAIRFPPSPEESWLPQVW